ncbi:MAG: hypothetical protein QOF89_3172 [Acidobacteriota bacterium]|jgi:hypothetical protein|nr:hypothetical protein [Acidobacteriota bacterium]
MATDVRLDDGDGTFLVLDARVVKAAGSDFMLDSAERRKGGGPFRRTLVHNQSDGLTVNFNGDYPGGVTINGVTEITPLRQQGQLFPTLVVRGAISYEVDVPTGASGQGAVEGETHTITVNVDELLSAQQSEIVKLTARVAALEALLNK